jgi:hypothetical protein
VGSAPSPFAGFSAPYPIRGIGDVRVAAVTPLPVASLIFVVSGLVRGACFR